RVQPTIAARACCCTPEPLPEGGGGGGIGGRRVECRCGGGLRCLRLRGGGARLAAAGRAGGTDGHQHVGGRRPAAHVEPRGPGVALERTAAVGAPFAVDASRIAAGPLELLLEGANDRSVFAGIEG